MRSLKKGARVRTAFIFAVILSGLLANIPAAQASASIKCVPQKVEPWPNNAELEIQASAGQLLMTITSEYYGVSLPEKYTVSGKDLVFTGEGVKLTISPTAKQKGFPALLESEKDGNQSMYCSKSGF
jgi:hypothetical protein